MAYGDSGAGNTGSGSVTFKGFSSRAERQNFKIYDFECAKQDLINRLSVRKGERVENPEFGTIIYDCMFEPLTASLKEAIVQDVSKNLNADPRIQADEIVLEEAEHGILIQASVKYVPLDITEKLRFSFDENSLLRLS